MPRIVDHDERRLQIAKVVEQLVLENGIEALTVRDIATRAGCSTSVVSHYFRNKLEMLVFTHREVRRRAENLMHLALEEGKDLASCLDLLLPTTEERWRDWHTWFAFWGMAPAEPAVSKEWVEGTSEANQIFVQLILAERKAGRVPMSTDATEAAIRCQIIVNGIASLVTQNQQAWPAKRQKAVLRDMLNQSIFRSA